MYKLNVWRYRTIYIDAEDIGENELTIVTYIAEGNETDSNP